jgi:apolipoprotein N-acyltransferase
MKSVPLSVTAREASTAVGLGLLSAASFPPFGFWLLILLAIALWLRLLRDLDPVRARNVGLIYGLVFGLGTMHWFFRLFAVMAVPLIALFAAYFGLLAFLISLKRGLPPWQRAMWTGVFAVAVEWLRGDAWYLRFPWYTAPHALAAAPEWVAAARWLGTYGLTFIIWTVAAAGVFGRPWIWLAFLLLPACSLLLPEVDAPDHRVLLLQTGETNSVESLVSSVSTDTADLVVMPEYSYFASYTSALASRQGPVALARKLGCPVIFGAVDGEYGTPAFDNVAVVIDSGGAIIGTFPKQRPVPLFLDGRPGKRRPVFALDQGTLGVAVCYDYDAPEIAASLVRQGATVLAAPTFDALWWGRLQHVQHELLLRLRAIENDRWILRAASSGRSEVIDPHGRPSLEGIEIGEKGTIAVGYGLRDGIALGGQTWVLGPASLVISVIAGLYAAWRSRKSKVGKGERGRQLPDG